jgi:signal transduction histidine kinase
LGLDEDRPPDDQSAWQVLLDRVSRAYTEADQDRYTLERSLSISSREMQDLYESLRTASESALTEERDRLRAALAELGARMAELKDAQSRVVEAERLAAIGQIAAGVTHEISNPVSYVLTNLDFLAKHIHDIGRLGELLDRGASAEDLGEWWDAIGAGGAVDEMLSMVADALEGARRIRDIVRDMRALVRKDDAGRTTYDLCDAIRSALRITAQEVRCSARLTLELSEELDVDGSAGRMSQVFVNLIVNAAQALRDLDRNDGNIRVAAWRSADRIFVEVGDDGPGIAPEHVDAIFLPFFTTKAPGSGTGLGLSISRDIVRWHGGDIRVESMLGLGTKFTIELPAASAPKSRRSRMVALG